jgi:hypothetical protein
MSNTITQPYGYKVFSIGTIRVYSAKIRVKADNTDFDFMFTSMVNNHPVIISNHKNNCVAISWATTDYIVHNMYRELLNNKLASIMHARIDTKYSNHHEVTMCL